MQLALTVETFVIGITVLIGVVGFIIDRGTRTPADTSARTSEQGDRL